MNQRSRAAIFGRVGGAVQFSRVCCSTRMHEDDARWPTVHTTGALSDGTPPDFDAGIRWLVDRKTSNAARAIRCLLVSFFAWDPRLCAPAPSQLLPAVRAVECAVSNAADPRVGAPCPLVCLVCLPVAGLLSRATPRHMQCASGRRRLLRTPLGAHHSTMARWRAS